MASVHVCDVCETRHGKLVVSRGAWRWRGTGFDKPSIRVDVCTHHDEEMKLRKKWTREQVQEWIAQRCPAPVAFMKDVS